MGMVIGKEGKGMEGGTSRRCYVEDAVVRWFVGLHWRVGAAWRRWSHMCSSWYFPRFLLRGVLTQMNMASLMVLDLLLTPCVLC